VNYGLLPYSVHYYLVAIQILGEVSLQDGSHVSDMREDGEEEGAVLVKKLPNELLGVAEKDDGGPVVLVTADKESYSCVLPNVAQEGSLEVSSLPVMYSGTLWSSLANIYCSRGGCGAEACLYVGMGDIRNNWSRLSCVKISRYSILSRRCLLVFLYTFRAKLEKFL